MFDVVIVGGGPGGAVSAKRCAESGLKTLLLEKKTIPRRKVCTGMLISPITQNLFVQEFEKIPLGDIAESQYYSGIKLHAPGIKSRKLDLKIFVAWRKDLDYWMIQKAESRGVIVRDGSRVEGIEKSNGIYSIKTSNDTLKARFVIGADGATSVVRHSLFPRLKVKYAGVTREVYKGDLEIEKDWWHWFFPVGKIRPRFDVSYKGGESFALEGGGLAKLNKEIKQYLLTYGFDTQWRPVWKDACALPLLHRELISGSFIPAKENTLLVGDAAGLPLPVAFEGIGTAIKSAVLAAASIINAIECGTEAESHYIIGLEPILDAIKALYPLEDWLIKEASKGAKQLLSAFLTTCEKAMIDQVW